MMGTGARQRARTRRVAVVAVLAAGTAGLLGGCGEDGISLPSGTATITLPSGTATISVPGIETPTEAPTTEEPTTEEPTTEEPTTEEPTTEEPTTEEPTTEEPTTEEPTQESSPSEEAAGPTDETEEGISPWWFVLLGLLVLVALIWWALARSARSRRDQAQLLDSLESRGQWVVDHGVGALIGATDPGSVQEAWSRLDATLTDMSGEVHRLADAGRGDRGSTVLEVRDAVSGLKLAAESHARARLGGESSPGTAESVFVARSRLSSALAALREPAAR